MRGAGRLPRRAKRARLGRWLFYDARLSSDRTLSCATCHRPEFAFSEPRDVVEYYNRGGNKNPFLTPRLRPLGLSQADVDDVVAFLKSLNGEGYQDRPPKFFPQ